MKIVLRLSPGFLRRFDDYLRMNYPWLWATRIHLNLYMAIFIMPLLAGIAFLVPAGRQDVVTMQVLMAATPLFYIPGIAWLIFQFRQLALYNVDKSYGMQSAYREFFVLCVYWATFLLPLCLPAIATTIFETKANNVLVLGGLSWQAALATSFLIAVFFNIFKHVRAKNFYLNFAFLGGLFYLISILSAIFMTGSVFIQGIMYICMIAVVYALIGFATGKRNFWLVQSTILLNSIAPFILIILLVYLTHVFGLFGSLLSNTFFWPGAHAVMESPETVIERSWLAKNIWTMMLWSGIILHLFLWNSLFKRAYIRLWNQPKSK
jgi:hypothetical protein